MFHYICRFSICTGDGSAITEIIAAMLRLLSHADNQIGFLNDCL